MGTGETCPTGFTTKDQEMSGASARDVLATKVTGAHPTGVALGTGALHDIHFHRTTMGTGVTGATGVTLSTGTPGVF